MQHTRIHKDAITQVSCIDVSCIYWYYEITVLQRDR